MFWVAGLFLDVYKDVPGCWGVSRCLRRCSVLLGCFYMFTKMFWVAGVFLYVYEDVLDAGVFINVYEDVLGCWGVSICL